MTNSKILIKKLLPIKQNRKTVKKTKQNVLSEKGQLLLTRIIIFGPVECII